MTLPERPISCLPWNATGPLPAKGSESGASSIRLSSEAFLAWFSHARRRIANAIGETGDLGLRNLRVPAEGHLADRRWDAREPRVWADNYAAGDDTTGSDTGRTLRPTIANAFRNGVPSPRCK